MRLGVDTSTIIEEEAAGAKYYDHGKEVDPYALFPKNLNVGDTDMVAVDNNKLIMMIRDLGHALTIEITINSDIARVEYFIPKICNANKVNKLPGVEKVSEDSSAPDSTTGITEFPISDLPQQLFDFLVKVPTDEDIEIIRQHW